jgi:signal transduction histidine kinase
MLDAFIIANRAAIIERALRGVGPLAHPGVLDADVAEGIPIFLDQVVAALRVERASDLVDHRDISVSAGRYGHDLLRRGMTIAQVVHVYGDVCQAITELALHSDGQISHEEFRTLNQCLDDAIAQAVTEFARQRELVVVNLGTERLGVLAHELRNLLNVAMLSFESIQSGHVSPSGSTGQVHGRSLMTLRDLIDRSLAEVRLDAGVQHVERVSVAELLEEIEIAAAIQARARGLFLSVTSVDRAVAVQADRQTLAAAISNLLHNAFKFTRKHSMIALTTRATDERVLFEVEDECGGLPPGKAEDLFRPFAQRGSDRSGVGLGLSICAKAAAAAGGEIRVRDCPGVGCVFTLDLPRLR